MKKIFLSFIFFWIAFSHGQTLQEDFESSPVGDIPSGWVKYQSDPSDPGFKITNSQAHAGTQSLYHNDTNLDSDGTAWIVSPAYTSTGNDMLSFYYLQRYRSYYNYSGVWYSTTGSNPLTNPGDWTEIAEFNDVDHPFSDNTWTQFISGINVPAGTSIYIGFKYVGDWDHRFYIDDFLLEPGPSCPGPTNLNASPQNANSVQLNWHENGTATEWELEYGLAGFTLGSGTRIQHITTTPYLLTGLNEATQYEFYVRSFCGGTDYSDWSGPYAWWQPPHNDLCSNAQSLNVYPPDNGIPITQNTAHGATDSGLHSTCDRTGINPDLFYSFIAPSDGKVIILTDGPAGDKIEAAIWDGCNGNEIICEGRGNRKIIQNLNPGQNYILQLWHDDFNAGEFTLILEEMPPIPSNDACESAIVVPSLPYSNTQNATGDTNNNGCVSCNSHGLNDGVWYTFVTGQVSGDITIEVTPRYWDAAIGLYEGSCNNLTCIAYADVHVGYGNEQITFTPASHTRYYIDVGYYHDVTDGFEGKFTIQINGNATLQFENFSGEDFRFYPNPTSNSISWNANGQVEKVQITDLAGQTVLKVENPAVHTLNISKLTKGIYILYVIMDGKQGTYKLVKE